LIHEDSNIFRTFAFRGLEPERVDLNRLVEGKGPKNIRIFMNQPTTVDFDKAVGMTSTQDITLTPAQLDSGELIPLKFVKFQNVQNLQLFMRDNQEGEEVTVVDQLHIIRCPIDATNMKDFKRVAGKAGESET
jgi:hypothetical protein